MPQYRRLTDMDRREIEYLYRSERSQSEIAQKVGFSVSTICRELQRNGGKFKYCWKQAHQQAERRLKRCRRRKAISSRQSRLFHQDLKQGGSPELFSGRLRLKRNRAPSTSTFYRHARAMGWSRTLLPRSGRRGAGRYIQRQKADWKVSIALRPESVLRRNRYGHWERDTLFAAGGQRLLVLIERKSRYLRIGVLPSATAEATHQLTQKLLRRCSLPKLTMTNDNGKEFNASPKLRMPVYHCEPRKPQQRGSVENINRLLRRHIARKADLSSFTKGDIRRIERLINNRPRKCLGYRTPAEIVRARRIALAMNM